MDYLIIIKLAFLVITFLVFLNWEVFWSEIKKINKKYIIGLISLFFVIVIIFNANLNFFPSYHEWGMLSAAKYLNSQTFFQEKEGLIYPAILAPFFKIFGASPEVAVLLNLFLAGACIFLIFFLTKIIFKNELVSFFTVLIFALNSLTVWYFFVKSGWPALTCFWLLSIEIVLILFFKNPQNFVFGILGMALIVLAGQIRPEFFILILLIPLGLLLYWRSIKEAYKNKPTSHLLFLLLIFILTFLIFSAPTFAKSFLRQQGGGGTCGYWTSETKLLIGEIPVSGLAIINWADKAIKSIFNNRFSVYYIMDDLSFLKRYLSVPPLLFALFFMIIGFVAGLKRNFRITILIFSTIFLISTIYILDCTYYLSRYFAPLYGLAVIFVGGGINFLIEKTDNHLKPKYLKLILFLIIVLLVSCNIGDLLKIKRLNPLQYYNYDGAEMTDYKKLKEVCGGLDRDQSVIIPMLLSERDILSFLGHNASQSLSGIISIDNLNFHQDKAKFYESFRLPTDDSKNNYLAIQKNYFNSLNPQPELRELIDYIFENYSLERVASNEAYDLYKVEF